MCSFGKPLHLQTDEGGMVGAGLSRQKTHMGLGLVRTGSSNSLARVRKMQDSWCRDVYENDEESSITSDFSSSVGIHRTPSNGFEDYQKRRETFLHRIGRQSGEP